METSNDRHPLFARTRMALLAGSADPGRDRFTSRELVQTEKLLQRATFRLEAGRRHGMDEQHRKLALVRAGCAAWCCRASSAVRSTMSPSHGLGFVIGYAGTGKSAM